VSESIRTTSSSMRCSSSNCRRRDRRPGQLMADRLRSRTFARASARELQSLSSSCLRGDRSETPFARQVRIWRTIASALGTPPTARSEWRRGRRGRDREGRRPSGRGMSAGSVCAARLLLRSWLSLSDRSSGLECRRHRNRDCFAPASLTFRCRPLGAARHLPSPALRLALDSIGSVGPAAVITPAVCALSARSRALLAPTQMLATERSSGASCCGSRPGGLSRRPRPTDQIAPIS
jgi:hypothetical protein